MTMPDRHHFMMRLIELELVEEHRGPIPVFDKHGDVSQSPTDETDSWQSIRFACRGCLKLRPARESHRKETNRLG